MERISSRQNPLVPRVRLLARGGADRVLLDGPHLLEEALASGVAVETVAVAERHLGGRFDALAARAAAAGARVVAVTDQVLAAMSPVREPSGIVAVAERRAATLDEVFAGRPPLVLLLADVQDPGNVGAIVRTAEACGATGLVAGDATADPFGWKALRGGMGSTFRLPVAVRQPLDAAAARARAEGLRLLSLVPRGGTSLPACDLRGPAALLLGSEGTGLPGQLVVLGDERITIPMRPPVESLNVAVAAALVLYEASRQRAGAGPDVPAGVAAPQ